MLPFSNGGYNSILPYEHDLPEKRELFREQWRYFRGFFKKARIRLLLQEVQALNHLQKV